ncbi:Platelet basic protein [Tupaia chinensis]|uniref:C-X-C motif chemokine n=2 Tax=Tupaia chinensis TaxID=246437 RepID=L9L9T0_TUPCH|nr:Platelet basic protein [Tupaia chinensis]
MATSSWTSASPRRVLQLLLPLTLLLTTLVPSTTGQSDNTENDFYLELRCMCVKAVSGIHPSNIRSVEVIKAGAHCAQTEVIATLKNGKKVCLDPEAPLVKKMIKKILEGGGSAA